MDDQPLDSPRLQEFEARMQAASAKSRAFHQRTKKQFTSLRATISATEIEIKVVDEDDIAEEASEADVSVLRPTICLGRSKLLEQSKEHDMVGLCSRLEAAKERAPGNGSDVEPIEEDSGDGTGTGRFQVPTSSEVQ